MTAVALARPKDRFDPAAPGGRDAVAGITVAENAAVAAAQD